MRQQARKSLAILVSMCFVTTSVALLGFASRDSSAGLFDPDLVAILVSGPATCSRGATITIIFDFMNDDDWGVTAQNFYFGLYLSTDNKITTADILVYEYHIASLADGAHVAAPASVTLPAGVWGTYYYGLFVDNHHTETEDSEANNAVASTSTVTIYYTDLHADSVSGPAGCIEGVSISISRSFTNTGNYAAGSFYSALYLSTDNIISTSDTLLSSYNHPDLAAGGTISGTFSVALPEGLNGTFYYGLFVDYTGVVYETDESDNTIASTSTVLVNITDDSYEVDDTYTQAKPIVPGVKQTHNINDGGTDVDWVTFKLVRKSNVTLETSGGDPYGDTEMWLYDSTNVPTSEIAYDDDGGPGAYSNITYNNLEPGTYYVKVDDNLNDNHIWRYYLDLSLVEQPWIEVTSPNGGETWQAATTRAITWDSGGGAGSNVNVSLYKGGVWSSTIVASTTNDGTYEWAIPSTLAVAADYRIRVNSTTTSAADDSNSTFSIMAPLTIIVTFPNGGENWQAGTTHTIIWTSQNNLGGVVKIELLKGGALSLVIVTATTNNGGYNWALPADLVAGADYKVRISDASSSAMDVSDGDFSVTAAVTAPSAPVDIHATAGDRSVALTWSAPSSDGGASITGYKIYRGTASGDLTLLASVTTTSYTDSGLTNGQTYYYAVCATNSAGEGPKSSETSATPASGGGGEVLGMSSLALGLIIVAIIIVAGIVSFLLLKRRKGAVPPYQQPPLAPPPP